MVARDGRAAPRSFAANRAVGQIALDGARDGRHHPARARARGRLAARALSRVRRRASSKRSSSTPRAAWPAATGSRSTSRSSAGARLVVTTAAAEKVYRSLGPDATVDVKLDGRRPAARSPGCRRRRSCSTGRGCARTHRGRSRRRRAARSRRSDRVRPLRHGRDGRRQGALFDRWRVRRGGRLVYAEAVRLDGAIAAQLARAGGRRRRRRGGDRAGRAGRRRDRRRACARSATDSAARSASRPGTALRSCGFARRDGAALRHDLVAVLAALARRALPRLWLN